MQPNMNMGNRGFRGNPNMRGGQRYTNNMNPNMRGMPPYQNQRGQPNPNMRGGMPMQQPPMMNPNMRGGMGMPMQMQGQMNPNMRGGMPMQQPPMMNPNMRGGMPMQQGGQMQMQPPNVKNQKMAYTSQARNTSNMPMGLDLAKLASLSAQEQKQILGETIYPMIHEKAPQMAGKITGMLLEMDNTEILLLLEDQENLNKKVSEAINVLQFHEAQLKENKN